MHLQLHLSSAVWRVCVVVLVLRACSSTMSQNISESYMQQLQLLFGLPSSDSTPVKQKEVPSFVNNVYSCLSDDSKDSCVPGYHAKDGNLLRTVLGTVESTPEPVLHAYNTARRLEDTTLLTFNVTLSTREVETTRYAILRLHRNALSSTQVKYVKDHCNNHESNNITLQLYSQTGTSGNASTVSLRAVHSLSLSDLAEEEWIEILNLTRLYTEFITVFPQDTTTSRKVHLWLAVGGPCSSLSPSDLGFQVLQDKERPQLVEFAENVLTKEMLFPQMLSVLAKEKLKSRSRRETTSNVGGVSTNGSGVQASVQSDLPPLDSNYKLRKCKLYQFTLSLGPFELSKRIIIPLSGSFRGNICAGRCDWPLPSTVKTSTHATLQALANYYHPHTLPAPCCVPTPGKLEKLYVTLEEANGFSTHEFINMIATECACW